MTSRSLVAGIGIGSGLTYFLDPGRGARRRAMVRDTVVHTSNLTRRALDATGRDAMQRASGTAAALRGLMRREEVGSVDDSVMVERVRAKLGHLVSHPGAVEVAASAGVITLQGPILKREAPRLIKAIRRVRGVKDVIDWLDVHEQPGNVPGLQGGSVPPGDRFDIFQEYWAPTTRVLIGTAGAALVATGARRRDLPGITAALVGMGLVARAAVNLPLDRLTGLGSRRRAVDLQKTITINAPVGEVYAFWSSYESFPRFMSRVLDVTTSERDPMRSHWTVAGPAGSPVKFDAEIRRAIPNQLIAWRTLKGSPVGHAGVVRFDHEADGATRVQVRMSYNPPAGWLGHGIATAFGVDPKSSLDADLLRMKTLIETGHAPHDAAQRNIE